MRDERGFTLIELLIVMIVVPIIIGAMSVSLISVFSLQSSVASRLGGSADSQVVTTNFTTDIQGAVTITTSSTQSQCGTGTQVLGIELGSGQYLSYNEVLQSDGSYNLVRSLCRDSAPADLLAPTSVQSLGFNMEQPCTPTVTLNCLVPVAYTNSTVVPTTTPTSTLGITSVRFDVVALGTKGNYSYSVSAEPLGADDTTSALGTTATGNSCGFALPGTGFYASQLCFFDFTKYFLNGAVPNNTPITELVPGGYTLTADLTVTGTPVVAAATFPTYSAAFFGNYNAASQETFYSGVGCPASDPTTYQSGGVTYGTTSCISPAIYQQGSANSQSNTVSLTNIKLTTATNGLVSGYEIVTADAETTDDNESIVWTSNLNFNQIPDTNDGSPTSYEGNACSTSIGGVLTLGGDITDGGGNVLPTPISNAPTVVCNSDWDSPSPRTGTLMLEVSPPASGTGANGTTSIQAVMTGTGLEGVSFGLLLP
jgi:prepilin-type N-terminal cleavage/methylation domain-containing protein